MRSLTRPQPHRIIRLGTCTGCVFAHESLFECVRPTGLCVTCKHKKATSCNRDCRARSCSLQLTAEGACAGGRTQPLPAAMHVQGTADAAARRPPRPRRGRLWQGL